MRRTIASLSVAVAILAAGAANAAGGAESTVTIDDYRGDGMKVFVRGSVSSPKGSCEPKREVNVIGRDEQTGDKRSFGTDVTSKAGKFKVSEPIPFQEDFVYAKVKPVKDGSSVKCKGDRSEEISTSG